MEPCSRFRFAVYTNNSDDADHWSAFARRAEELGFAALYVTDHLGRQLAPTAALAAAAAVTHNLRIGPYVFANDFRHPLIVGSRGGNARPAERRAP